MSHVCRSQIYGSVRYKCGSQKIVLFIKENPGEKIDVLTLERANGAELTRPVLRHAPALDLKTQPITADSIDVWKRTSGARPSECAAKQMFRKIPGRIVRGARNASGTQFVSNFWVKRQQGFT